MTSPAISTIIRDADITSVSSEAASRVPSVTASSLDDGRGVSYPLLSPRGGLIVPRRPKDFDYQRYLASREWALLKEQVRERSQGYCEHCKAADYEETHHSTYERIGQEDIGDLGAVCRPCHAWLSAKSDVNPLVDRWLYSVRCNSSNDEAFHLVYRLHLNQPVAIVAAICYVEPLFNTCLWCKYGGLRIGNFMKAYKLEAFPL